MVNYNIDVKLVYGSASNGDASQIRSVAVTTTTPSDGDILVYRSATDEYVLEPKPIGGSNPSLDDISNVTITNVTDGELFVYDSVSSDWINQTIAEAGFSTVSTTGDYDDLTNKPTIPTTLAQLDTTVTGSELNGIKTKSDHITVTQAVDLDTIESNVASNNSFRTTPSSVITAGTNLTWSGNTLNATGGISSIDWGDINGTLSNQTDLQNALNAKQATITNSDDITEGVTNLFLTAAERAKLISIATGAEVNVQSDWNAVSGDALILNKPSIPTDFSDFANVDSTVASPSDGDILVYRSAGSDWVLEAKPAGGSNPALDDITNVTITSVADNEILSYDSTSGLWINQTASELGFATVATSGAYTDLSGLPTLGSLASLSSVGAAQINDGAVSLVKLDDIDSQRFIGREAAGSGTPEALAPAQVRSILNVADGADVTNTASVTAAGALMDSEVTSLSGVKTLTIPDNTTISSFGASLVDDADAATARSTLGAGTLSNVSEDTTPQLGGELDAQAHSIGFTLQTATGDGTTTIDWRNGNKFKFTFGAFNETFTFTAPSKPCSLQLIMVQDSVGSRTATWPASVKWVGGTAPTLTTTATTGTDIISFFFDGTNYYGGASLDFS